MKTAEAFFCIRIAAAAIPGAVSGWSALADQGTQQAPFLQPNRSLSANADLDMVVRIGKFVYLRVGNTGDSINTLTFQGTSSIPVGGTTPANGNNVGVAWNGATPTMTFAPVGNVVLPVEVASNSGQVSLVATVVAPLASGSNIIPMSQVSVTSSNALLPAPPIPATGVGTSVNVTGTAFANLVTSRSANWTFGFADTTSRAAGNYVGQLAFTASNP